MKEQQRFVTMCAKTFYAPDDAYLRNYPEAPYLKEQFRLLKEFAAKYPHSYPETVNARSFPDLQTLLKDILSQTDSLSKTSTWQNNYYNRMQACSNAWGWIRWMARSSRAVNVFGIELSRADSRVNLEPNLAKYLKWALTCKVNNTILDLVQLVQLIMLDENLRLLYCPAWKIACFSRSRSHTFQWMCMSYDSV